MVVKLIIGNYMPVNEVGHVPVLGLDIDVEVLLETLAHNSPEITYIHFSKIYVIDFNFVMFLPKLI